MMMVNDMVNAARRLFSEKMHTQGPPDNRPAREYPKAQGIFSALPVTAGQFIWVSVYGTLGSQQQS
jgi:hypothetical protein